VRESEASTDAIEIEFSHSSWDTLEPIIFEFNFAGVDWQGDEEDFIPKNSLIDFEQVKASGNKKIIVGLNGSGKTTLLKFLQEYYSLNETLNKTKATEFMKTWGEKGVREFKSRHYFNYHNEVDIYDGRSNPEDFIIGCDHCDWVSRDTYEYFHGLAQPSTLPKSDNPDEQVVYCLIEDLRMAPQIREVMAKMSYEHYLENLQSDMFFKKKLRSSLTTIEGELMVISLCLHSTIDFDKQVHSLQIEVGFRDTIWDLKMQRSEEITSKFTLDIPDSFILPRDFDNTMRIIIDRINLEHKTNYSKNDKLPFLFPNPTFNPPLYISALEVLDTRSIPDELLECMDQYNEGIESYLEDQSERKIFEWFDVKEVSFLCKNGESGVRSFTEIPTPDGTGSEESIPLESNNNEFSPGVTHLEVIREIENKGLYKAGLKFKELNDPEKRKEFWVGSEALYCEIGDYTINEGIIAERYFGDVIINMNYEFLASGIAYSNDRKSLLSFLKREIWREISDKKKMELFSRIFDVNLSEIRAFRAVQEISSNDQLQSYLTSGQSRVYSIIKSIQSKDYTRMILIDEPEVSLHIDWQRKIIDLISKYSRSPIMIVATHSPDIIYHHIPDVIELNSKIDE
jgi:ABC-type lipoprotein export system ATPase subunit